MINRLGDYIQEISLRNKSDEQIPVYSVTNTQGFCKDYFGKEVASKDKKTYKIVPKGCFAYNPSRINVGSVDWQRHEERVIVSPLYNVFSVSESIRKQYLYYYLKSDFVLQRIRCVATGSVRDNLKIEMLKEFPITIPTLSEQDRIAKVLDTIKSVIDLRKKELEALDDLTRSRFIEMFENGNYQVEKLDKLCKKITDGTHKTPTYLTEGITFISAKNIVNGELDFTNIKHISEEEYQEIQKRCQTAIYDILLSKSGSLGSPVIVKTEEKLGLFESLAVIKYDRERLLPEFLCEQLKTDRIQRQFATGTKGVAIKHLHLGVIAAIDIIVPPLNKQKTFSDFVKQIDKLKELALYKSNIMECRSE